MGPAALGGDVMASAYVDGICACEDVLAGVSAVGARSGCMRESGSRDVARAECGGGLAKAPGPIGGLGGADSLMLGGVYSLATASSGNGIQIVRFILSDR